MVLALIDGHAFADFGRNSEQMSSSVESQSGFGADQQAFGCRRGSRKNWVSERALRNHVQFIFCDSSDGPVSRVGDQVEQVLPEDGGTGVTSPAL